MTGDIHVPPVSPGARSSPAGVEQLPTREPRYFGEYFALAGSRTPFVRAERPFPSLTIPPTSTTRHVLPPERTIQSARGFDWRREWRTFHCDSEDALGRKAVLGTAKSARSITTGRVILDTLFGAYAVAIR